MFRAHGKPLDLFGLDACVLMDGLADELFKVSIKAGTKRANRSLVGWCSHAYIASLYE